MPSIIADFGGSVKYVSLYSVWDESSHDPSIMSQRAIDSVHGPYDLIHLVKLSQWSGVFAHTFFQNGVKYYALHQ